MIKEIKKPVAPAMRKIIKGGWKWIEQDTKKKEITMFKMFRRKLADKVCLLLAPDVFIINPKMNPFKKLQEERAAQGLDSTTERTSFEGLAAQALIRGVVEAKQESIEVEIIGFSILGEDCGNWKVTVEKVQ